MNRSVRSARGVALVSCALAVMAGCRKGSPAQPSTITNFTAGAWGYVITADSVGVPLSGTHGATGCGPPDISGTTTVNSSGAFSIQYTFAPCDNCTESGTVTGTVAPLGPSDTFPALSGTVAISEQGSGCSIPDPPEPVSGTCTYTECAAQTPDNTYYFVGVTLTPSAGASQ